MLPIPDIKTQKKYVSAFKALKQNQTSYENSFDDLRLIAEGYMESLAVKHELQELGPYIKQIDNRNLGPKTTRLRGISTSKKLIESKANTSGVNFEKYKLVESGQFAYVADTSRRGDKIAVALNEEDTCIVSSIYTVFEIVNHGKLLPKFLLLWFKRSEFDRYARYNSWGSARETFEWSEMQRVKLPIPPLEVQRSIVAIHNVLESRKKLNNTLKSKIDELSPILVKGVTQVLARTS